MVIENVGKIKKITGQEVTVLDSSRKPQTVLGSFKQFSEVLTVLGTLKQFSKILNSSWNFETVLGSLKKFLELSNSFRKSQKTVLRNHKQFPGVSMRCWGSKKILEIFKKFSVLSESGFTTITRCVKKIGNLQQNPWIKPLQEFNLLWKLQTTVNRSLSKTELLYGKFSKTLLRYTQFLGIFRALEGHLFIVCNHVKLSQF